MTTKLRICAEKYLPSEDKIVRQMYQKSAKASRLRAAFITQKIWPDNASITIGFFSDNDNPNLEYTPLDILDRDGKMDPIEKEIRNLSPRECVIKVVSERIKPIVGLKIDFVENVYDANIRVSFEDDGAWSYVGTDILQQPKGEATMNFGWIDAATIIHEFGHALGMIHEHQNPRGKTIPWDKEAVYNWAATTQGWDKQTTDVNILDHYDLNLTNGSEFDPQSIMLYFFPGKLTTDGKGTKQNVRLSGTDVFWLNKHYPNSKMTPEEFFEEEYGLDIEDSLIETSSSSGSSFSNWLSDYWWLVIIIILIFGVIAYLKYSKKYDRALYFSSNSTQFSSESPEFFKLMSLIK